MIVGSDGTDTSLLLKMTVPDFLPIDLSKNVWSSDENGYFNTAIWTQRFRFDSESPAILRGIV